MLLVTIAWAAPPAPAAAPPPLPAMNHGIVLSLDVRGQHVIGHVVADTAAFGKLGLAVWQEQTQRTEAWVPLVHGMRILGLKGGERLIDDAIPSLLYFDANEDGYLDAADPAFVALSLFVDKNGNGKLEAGEARTLGDLGVDCISRFGSIRMKER